jgi:hypothetical protein
MVGATTQQLKHMLQGHLIHRRRIASFIICTGTDLRLEARSTYRARKRARKAFCFCASVRRSGSTFSRLNSNFAATFCKELAHVHSKALPLATCHCMNALADIKALYTKCRRTSHPIVALALQLCLRTLRPSINIHTQTSSPQLPCEFLDNVKAFIY